MVESPRHGGPNGEAAPRDLAAFPRAATQAAAAEMVRGGSPLGVRLVNPEAEPRWAPIKGFPSYEVSDDGFVRRAVQDRYGRRVLRQHINGDGYPFVVLFRGGKRHHALVHRLVAEAFVLGREAGPIVRHLDGCKARNLAENLAWGTQQENIDDRGRHGTTCRGESSPNASLTEAAVRAIRAAPKRRGMFAELAARFGSTVSAVKQAYYGRTWRHV
jgi:hypothetical protein